MFTKGQVAESILLVIQARAVSAPPGKRFEKPGTIAIAERMQRDVAASIASGADWLTARQVFERAGRDPASASSAVGRWLMQGRVFALTCRNVRVYPRYAFDAEGRPLRWLREVIGCFGDRLPVQVAAWFESRSSALDGQRPRELIGRDGEKVLRAAKLHRQGAVHG